MRPRRRTPQQEQEIESRRQISSAWKSWPQQTPVEDLGEDLLFQVYDQGSSSGLTFFVQLKSVAKLGLVRRNKLGTVLRYALPVKDIEHWEGFSTPVVVVLWAVEEQQGVWEEVSAIVADLDKNRPTWRSQRTVTVSLPMSHTTDDVGRTSLRQEIFHKMLPVLGNGRTVSISTGFNFPETEEGKTQFETLRTTLDEGGTVTVASENIVDFKISDWFERGAGQVNPASITISSTNSEKTVLLRLRTSTPERTESLDVALRHAAQGRKKVTYRSSPEDAIDVEMAIQMENAKATHVSYQITFKHLVPDILRTYEVARFLRVLKSSGSFHVHPEGSKAAGRVVEFTPDLDTDMLKHREALLQKLAYIQSRVSHLGQLDMLKIGKESAGTIDALYQGLSTGSMASTLSSTITLGPRSPDSTNEDSEALEIRAEGGEVELLGVSIPLGRVEVQFQDPGLILGPIREWNAGTRSDPRVDIRDADVVEVLLDWREGGLGPTGQGSVH